MELSDVVNAHFAFPVVGVVLCAVLVFAFGFKSPGEPPSFDALEEFEKKSKKSRQRKQSHSEKKHGNDDAVDTTARCAAGGARHPPSPASSSGSGAAGGRNVGGKTTTSIVPAAPANAISTANKLKPLKLVKKLGDADESFLQQESAVIGDWTTAVSRKERKNRSKRDDASKHERVTSVGDVHLVETHNWSQSPGSNKSKNKLSEMPKVTVTVPASHAAHAAATTSTTVTKSAVVKLKVVPPVHVSTGNGVTPAGSPGNQQVLARNSDIVQETEANQCFLEVASESVVDSYQTENSSTNIDDDDYGDWSEVKSAKSPRRWKGTSADAVENEKLMTAGITVLPTTVNTEGRQSRTADAPTVLITKHSSSPASKPEASQQRINSRDIAVKTDVRVNSGSIKVQAPSQRINPASVPLHTKSDSSKKLQTSKQENVKIDVGMSPRLPESPHKNLPTAASAVETDCSQPNATGDMSSAGTAEAVACNGSEMKADCTTGVESSDETGDWHEAMSLKRRKRLRKDT